jgi:alpha-tubulin suppressor-like RCC1 family protein
MENSLVLVTNFIFILTSLGFNSSAQLGYADVLKRSTPTEVPFFNNLNVVQMSAGEAHSAVLTKDGSLYVFGSSRHGQCASESTRDVPPTKVNHLLGDKRVKLVSCGFNHVIALCVEDNSVWAWGNNSKGQLGINNLVDQHIPVRLTYLVDKTVNFIACGGDQSACVCEHQWVPDKDALNCMSCTAEFTGFRRRHHCRSK